MQKLEPVNVHTTFCQGCGIAPRPKDGEECRTCNSILHTVWKTNRTGVPAALWAVLVLGIAIVAYGAYLAAKVGH